MASEDDLVHTFLLRRRPGERERERKRKREIRSLLYTRAQELESEQMGSEKEEDGDASDIQHGHELDGLLLSYLVSDGEEHPESENEEHGGAIDVNSVPQHGDEEYLDLPDLLSDDEDHPIPRYIHFVAVGHSHNSCEANPRLPAGHIRLLCSEVRQSSDEI